METKVEEQATFVDTVKLALAVLILLAGLFSYYYFANSAVLLLRIDRQRHQLGTLGPVTIATRPSSFTTTPRGSRRTWPGRSGGA